MSAKEQTKNRVAIAGRVIDAETKLAIPGVLVKITQMPEKFKNWLKLHALQYGKSWDKIVKRPDKTLTAVDGCFCFINLPDGEYTLSVSLPGARTSYGKVDKEVTVASNGNSDKIIVIDLPPTGIKGQITELKTGEVINKGQNSSLKPVVMARIQVEGSGESTFSDNNGKYKLYILMELEKDRNEKNVKVFVGGQEVRSKSEIFRRGEIKELDFQLSGNYRVKDIILQKQNIAPESEY